MAINPDYFISGVWKTSKDEVSQVFLHTNSDNNISQGLKVAKNNLIELIKKNKKIMTLRWSYESSRWLHGALLEVVVIDDEEVLRTLKNSSPLDSLENQLNLSLLPQIFITSVKP